MHIQKNEHTSYYYIHDTFSTINKNRRNADFIHIIEHFLQQVSRKIFRISPDAHRSFLHSRNTHSKLGTSVSHTNNDLRKNVTVQQSTHKIGRDRFKTSNSDRPINKKPLSIQQNAFL